MHYKNKKSLNKKDKSILYIRKNAFSNAFLRIFILLYLLFFSCGKKENIYLLPSNYKLPSKILKQELKIKIEKDGRLEILNAKLWYRNNKVRIEMQKEDKELKKVIIMDEKKFYLIDEKSKTSYMCARNSDHALNFLGDVIINAGIGKTTEKIAGIEKAMKQDCFVYYYNMFVQYQGFFCPAFIKEYRTKKDDSVVKIIAEIKPHSSGNDKIVKTLEVIKSFQWIFISDKLFKINEDIKIIELKGLKK